jgi:hypothetical protein
MKNVHTTDLNNKNLDLLPIRRGCKGLCACLGICEQVIGYVPRDDYEAFLKTIPSTDEFLTRYIKEK